MLTKNNKRMLQETFREKRAAIISKAFLIIRPDNLPQLLKPILARTHKKCAISGRDIEPGQYAYPCIENPLRLNPYGDSRVLIEEAESYGDKILPRGFHIFKIPTAEAISSRKDIRKLEALVSDTIGAEAKKLLLEGKIER